MIGKIDAFKFLHFQQKGCAINSMFQTWIENAKLDLCGKSQKFIKKQDICYSSFKFINFLSIWRDVTQRIDQHIRSLILENFWRKMLQRPKLDVNLSQPLRIIVRYNGRPQNGQKRSTQWYMEVDVGYHKSYTSDFNLSLLVYAWFSNLCLNFHVGRLSCPTGVYFI